MIPEALHLRNFLSHRETDLELRGVHLASLVGDNGAGKSALLDSITWAVWGRSRAPYGHDEDLVYHGERGMEVEFVFRMPYQGGAERRFRILRRRERRGRRSTSSILDFQVEGDDGWHVLTADSIRETQARIIKQLGLDYDTFINSAYLRQGHADEFTVQSPTERKRVLSAILGLDRWAEYQDRVKKQLSVIQGQIKEIDRRLDEIESDLTRRPEYELQLQEAKDRVQQAESQLNAIQVQVEELTRIQEQALALKRQIDDLSQRIELEQEHLEKLRMDEDAHQGRLTYYQGLVDNADTIEENYHAYQDMLAEANAWSDKLSQAAKLQEEKSQLEQVIAQAREAINTQLRATEQEAARLEKAITEARAQIEQSLSDLRGKIAVLEERQPSPELLSDLKAAEDELVSLDALADLLEEHRDNLQEMAVERSRLTERNRYLLEVMNETKSRLEALEDAEATCPLCQQPLTPEHRQRLLREIQLEGKTMGDEYRANADRLRTIKDENKALKRQIQEQEHKLRARSQQAQQVARLQQQVEQGEDALRRATEFGDQVLALEQRLSDEDYASAERDSLSQVLDAKRQFQVQLHEGSYAGEARSALEQLLSQLEVLGYDAKRHNAARARLQELHTAETDFRELEKARIGVQGELETLQRLAGEMDTQQKSLAALETERAVCQKDLEALQPRLTEAPRLSDALNAARQEVAQAGQRFGAARQNLAALETLERRLKSMRENRETLADRLVLLSELREAFGVNGIPAMIIEHTLPELELEANRILQQLTGGRMHIRFETQRETKAGDLRETLDIVISDEKGSRPYENFSGGEQFRINFSIRVALSRLLAQRSGVRLRALFVDEGFGALDADGRRRLVEAVKAVQDEFDMILVITHINELREAFPTQIQVTKSDSGSQVDLF